jgi:hypothetical protein
VKGYAVYRNDPTFLLKTASVCETCFLSYAELTVTSFVQLSKRIIDPGGCEEETKGAHYNYPDSVNDKPHEGRKKIVKASVGNTDRNEFDSVQPPELPPPIEMPPPIIESATELQTDNIPTWIDRDLDNARRNTYFPPSADYSKKNLEHMIVSQQMLSEAAKGPSKLRAVAAKNPYAENLEKLA